MKNYNHFGNRLEITYATTPYYTYSQITRLQNISSTKDAHDNAKQQRKST